MTTTKWIKMMRQISDVMYIATPCHVPQTVTLVIASWADVILLFHTDQHNRVHHSEEVPRSSIMAPCVVVERLEGKQRCSRAAVGEHTGIQAREWPRWLFTRNKRSMKNDHTPAIAHYTITTVRRPDNIRSSALVRGRSTQFMANPCRWPQKRSRGYIVAMKRGYIVAIFAGFFEKVEGVTTTSNLQSLTSLEMIKCTLRAPNKTTTLYLYEEWSKQSLFHVDLVYCDCKHLCSSNNIRTENMHVYLASLVNIHVYLVSNVTYMRETSSLRPALQQGCGRQTPRASALFSWTNLLHISTSRSIRSRFLYLFGTCKRMISDWTTIFVESCHCAATLFSQVPKKYADLDPLHLDNIETHSKFTRQH